MLSATRGRLHVVDAKALGQLSCECHQTVQENYSSLLGAPWPQANRVEPSPQF